MTMQTAKQEPHGRFGRFGGIYVPETLMGTLLEVAEAYQAARGDPAFQQELDYYLAYYVGRPTSLYYCARLTEHCGGAKIYLKREDLAHTGSHKLNNALGQALLAKRMGRTKLLAETGARSMEVKRSVHDAFNAKVDEANQTWAWGSPHVSSWYKSKSGRVSQNWPYGLIDYWRATLAPNPDDFVLEREPEPVA